MTKQDLATVSVDKANHNDSTMGGKMKGFKLAALVAVMAFFGISAVPALASNQSVKDACPAPFAIGYTCQFQPAIKTTKSHTHIVVKKSVTERIKQYEKAKNVVVSINMGSPMSGAGCTDPTDPTAHADWDFHVGDAFTNTRKYGSPFTDTWHAGRMVCDWHLEQDSKGQWWVVGTKDNCRNRGIRIPVRHTIPKPKKQVVVFVSTKTFESTYDRLFTNTSSTKYSCPNGWSLTYRSGKGWCFKATQIPVSTPTPAPPSPTPPNPTAVCFIGSSPQYVWPSGYVVGQVGPNNQCIAVAQANTCPVSGQVRDANGNCVNQTNAAELHCQQVAQGYPGATVNFNQNTLTCTITQVNANCSNVVVIIGNGSPQITQQGNCNSSPPPPTPTKPGMTLNFIEEMDASQVVQGQTMWSTRPVCGTATGKAGDVVAVTFRADYGSFDNPTATVTIGSNGTAPACATIKAPTHGDVTDHVYAKPYDQTTGTWGDEVSSNGFAVKTAVPPPA